MKTKKTNDPNQYLGRLNVNVLDPRSNESPLVSLSLTIECEINKVNHAFNMSQGEQYSLVYDPQARLNFKGIWLSLLQLF
jgi:hypothetical protein